MTMPLYMSISIYITSSSSRPGRLIDHFHLSNDTGHRREMLSQAHDGKLKKHRSTAQPASVANLPSTSLIVQNEPYDHAYHSKEYSPNT
jgi:hypothetical protein